MPDTHAPLSMRIGLTIAAVPSLGALICPHKRRPVTTDRDCRAPWKLTIEPHGQLSVWPGYRALPSTIDPAMNLRTSGHR